MLRLSTPGRVWGLACLALVAVLGSTPPIVQADPVTVAARDSNFNQGQPLALSGGQIVFSSPTLADLDADGELDIVVGGSDGVVHAVRSNGTVLWSYQVADAINPYVSNPTSTSVIRSAPSVGDLDGDGDPEVVIGVGGVCSLDQFGQPDVNGGLVVLNHEGDLLSESWPVITYDQVGCDHDGYTDAIATSPALGDLDGDGDLEIVATSFDMRIYAWHHNGASVQGWPKFVRETPWSPVGLADLDDDGALEVIALIPTHEELGFGTIDGGELQIYRGDGTLSCKAVIDQGFTSAPAIGDLDGDGHLEIVAGTGDWYQDQGTRRGWNVHAWDGSCNVRSGWPVSTHNYMSAAPALADLDSDGTLEVIATSGTRNWGSLDRRIYAWRHDGASVSGFPVLVSDYWGNTGVYPLSPIVADWDGDGYPEVFASVAWEIAGVRGDGVQFSYYPDTTVFGKSFWGRYQLSNNPAIGDIDSDGRLELVIASVATEADPSRGGIIVYESPVSGGDTPWPMLGGNARHTHLYSKDSTDDAVVVAHTIPQVMAPGTSYVKDITMENSGQTVWTTTAGYELAAESSASAFSVGKGISLGSGQQVAPGESEVFSIQVHAPETPGYYVAEWRMTRNGTAFGAKLRLRVKVGNDPAVYVLSRDSTQSADGTSVYPGGLAEAMPAPSDAAGYVWDSVAAFASLPDGSGYHVISQYGWTTWSAGATVLGILPYSSDQAWVGLGMLADGTAFYAVDRDGDLHYTDGAEPLAMTGVPAGMVRDITVTPDGKGILVLDELGRVYQAGNGPQLSPPTGVPFSEPIASRIKLTRDGDGYYILDAYGRLWRSGNATSLAPNYASQIGEDWARDFELTGDELGYYVLDKYGNIHTGGNASPVTVNLPPVWDSDQAVDLIVADSRVSSDPYLVLSGSEISMFVELDGRSPLGNVNLRSGGGGDELEWEVAISPDVSWLGVSPVSGTTPGDVTLSVSAQVTDGTSVISLPLGAYSTTLVFDVTSLDGAPVSTVDVPVALNIWEEIHRAYIPLVTKDSY